MSDENKNLPARRVRATFLDQVRSSKALTGEPKKQTLAKAIDCEQRPRLLFAMDATASREASWNVAKEITGAMFEAVPGALDVALAYHGGGRLQELTSFSTNAKAFREQIHLVSCQAGRTALNHILDNALKIPRLKALIYVGDCFEESAIEAVELAQQLKLKGVRCFMFHDQSPQSQGYNTDTARIVFEQIAQITGGALFPFDETSPMAVRELLEAIAVYAPHGLKALKALAQKNQTLPAARLLLVVCQEIIEG